MRLTHIKLAGFKSFTDPTTIHVPSQLVGVVGPNGCGKSNVIDAVRWVLGEASAKQLRGESMQDVIFNGAATRRPAPRAWVELVFDNSDHSLQGAWGKYSEISIKRQLTRQGESTYYINGQTVRRRDITDLFLGTGVGARGYAVIEQGMISRIIEARPEELRAYIEEAAGVSKYKERRRETEARLKDSRDHLQRLADLQSELTRQSSKLEKQAQTAQRYRKLTTQLQQQQNLLNYLLWQQALQVADEAALRHQEAEQQHQTLQAQQQQLDETIQQLHQAEHEQQQQQRRLAAQHNVLHEQTVRLEEQLRARQNLIERQERERAQARAALQTIALQQNQLQGEIEQVQTEITNQSALLDTLQQELEEAEAALPQAETAQHDLDNAQRHQKEETARLKRELALKQQQRQHQHDRLQHNQQRQHTLQHEQNQLQLPEASAIQAAQEAAQQAQTQVQHSQNRLQVTQNELETLQQQAEHTQQQRKQLAEQHLQAQTRAQTLAQLLQQQHHNTDFWHNSPQTDNPRLWQQLRITPQWQHALAVILGERLHSVAVEADYSPPQPLPTARAAWHHPSDQTAAAPAANSLLAHIQAPANLQVALNTWLTGILCAPHLDFALQNRDQLHAQQSWLTPEGHRIDRHSVMLYNPEAPSNLLQQQADHDASQQQADRLAPQLAQAEAQCQQLHTQIQAQQTQLKQQQQQLHDQHEQLNQDRNHAAALLERSAQAQLRHDHIQREHEQLQLENEQLHMICDQLEADILALEEALFQLESQESQLENQLQHARTQSQNARLQLLEANRRHGAAQIQLHKHQQHEHNLQQQLHTLEEQSRDWQEKQIELELAQTQADDPDKNQDTLLQLAEQSHAAQEAAQEAQIALEHTQEQSRQAYAEQQRLLHSSQSLQQTVQHTLLQQQEALIHARHSHDKLQHAQADLEQLARTAAEMPDLPSGGLNTLDRELTELNQAIQALGAVNLAALEELSQAREREAYYQSQNRDLLEAVAQLEQAIAQIDNETKARFKETFDAVNNKVQTYFPTLFGGGQAQLHMVGDDLLSAGVAIMARPPGKKNSTIHLLSGGEKALTAMSLVFALFSLNPAPFCLLDEVDAPLDDANTSRFCNLVKEMSAQTQFLYISHNRLTMEMAEQLIGVTMQEKGVSRIVAVDIEHAISMAES